jgi:hypothetical protein
LPSSRESLSPVVNDSDEMLFVKAKQSGETQDNSEELLHGENYFDGWFFRISANRALNVTTLFFVVPASTAFVA